MVSEQFIDRVFMCGKATVTKKAWIEAIGGKDSLFAINMSLSFKSKKDQPEEPYKLDEGPIEWFFSPRCIRESFQNFIV